MLKPGTRNFKYKTWKIVNGAPGESQKYIWIFKKINYKCFHSFFQNVEKQAIIVMQVNVEKNCFIEIEPNWKIFFLALLQSRGFSIIQHPNVATEHFNESVLFFSHDNLKVICKSQCFICWWTENLQMHLFMWQNIGYEAVFVN